MKEKSVLKERAKIKRIEKIRQKEEEGALLKEDEAARLVQKALLEEEARLRERALLEEAERVRKREMEERISRYAFGAAAWNRYFGDVGAEPLLPADIRAILESPCPFWPDKRVEETHLLVLIPQTVSGRPLTMQSLGKLVQSPREGFRTQYSYFNLGEYHDSPAAASHWVLMTKDVLPESRSKSYADQQALLARHARYQVPSLLDATVCIFMEHVRSGTRLYSDSPWTFTRCQEKYNARWQLVVGGFAGGGLNVPSLSDDVHVGVCSLRKF